MARRNKQASAFDLFAFQDVITSTMGILLMMALLLALSIAGSRVQQMLESKRLKAEAHQQLQATVLLLEKEKSDRLELQGYLAKDQAELRTYIQGDIDGLRKVEISPEYKKDAIKLDLTLAGDLPKPAIILLEGKTIRLINNKKSYPIKVQGHDGLWVKMAANRWKRDKIEGRAKLIFDSVIKDASGHSQTQYESLLFLVKPSAFHFYGPDSYHSWVRWVADIGANMSDVKVSIELIHEEWEVIHED